jgi:hypothetical protein
MFGFGFPLTDNEDNEGRRDVTERDENEETGED